MVTAIVHHPWKTKFRGKLNVTVAGYSKLYVIGDPGGFQGADGVNPIQFLVLIGDGNRQWLEPHYFDASIKPIGKLARIVP